MGTPPGWYDDGSGADRLRFWDGTDWTRDTASREQSDPTRSAPQQPHRGKDARRQHGVSAGQVAHDLAIAYINNRYGIEVTGEFSVTSSIGSEIDAVRDVDGRGEVITERHPGPHEPEMVRVGTGQRHFFGVGPEKTQLVPTGKYEVDQIFRAMIDDYYAAYWRILMLLERRDESL